MNQEPRMNTNKRKSRKINTNEKSVEITVRFE